LVPTTLRPTPTMLGMDRLPALFPTHRNPLLQLSRAALPGRVTAPSDAEGCEWPFCPIYKLVCFLYFKNSDDLCFRSHLELSHYRSHSFYVQKEEKLMLWTPPTTFPSDKPPSPPKLLTLWLRDLFSTAGKIQGQKLAPQVFLY